MTKTQVVRIVRETATQKKANLSREEKQAVFNNVVDGLYREGRISRKQMTSWTHAFWTQQQQLIQFRLQQTEDIYLS